MINETAPVGRGQVPAVRVSGRQLAYTSLYAVGSSCTGGDMSPPYKDFHGNDTKGGVPLAIAKPVRTLVVAISCRNYPIDRKIVK